MAARWSLEPAVKSDIDELMTWFPDASSVDIWGGPRFRFPFDKESFHEDCRLQEFATYCLRNSKGEFIAFGQLGLRYERSHFARLVVHPEQRSQGLGRKLLEMMIDVARERQTCKEVGLFVYRHNRAAYRCYRAAGFKLRDYPAAAPMADKCYYMTRMV